MPDGNPSSPKQQQQQPLGGGVRHDEELPPFAAKKRSRRTKKVCILFLSLVLLFVCLGCGSAIYLAVRRQRSGLPPDFDRRTVAGSFRLLNRRFVSAMSTRATEAFRNLSQEITFELDHLYGSSSLKGAYRRSEVTSLSVGSNATIVVECLVDFLGGDPLTAEKAGLVFMEGLRSRHGHRWLGNLSVDILSLLFTDRQQGAAPGGSTAATAATTTATTARTDAQRTRQQKPPPSSLRPSQWSPWSPCVPCGLNATVSVSSRWRLCSEAAAPAVGAEGPSPPCRRAGTEWERKACRCQDRQEGKEEEEEAEEGRRPAAACAPPPGACATGEVCLAFPNETLPSCRAKKDPEDPTGCAGWCIIGRQRCRRTGRTTFQCEDAATCDPGQWQCSNGFCIPEMNRCDGTFECYDASDERDCVCDGPQRFQCGMNRSCVPLSKVCDGVPDCWDGADEGSCSPEAGEGCAGGSFRCDSGQCVPQEHFCDGFEDCTDGSDEPLGCGTCRSTEWQCSNLRCIGKARLCDQRDDCGDNSDEVCPHRTAA